MNHISDDSLRSIINWCLSLNRTYHFKLTRYSYELIFSGTATVCPKTKRKNWGCSRPNENAMLLAAGRSSRCPSPSTPPQPVNWSDSRLDQDYSALMFHFSVRRLDSGRRHLYLSLACWPRACLAPNVLQLLLLPGQTLAKYYGGYSEIPCQTLVYSEMIYLVANCVKAHSKEVCFKFIHLSNCYHVENIYVSTKIFFCQWREIFIVGHCPLADTWGLMTCLAPADAGSKYN